MQIYDIQNNLISSFDVYDDAYIEKTHNKLDILFFRVPKSLGFKIQEEGYVEIPEGRFVVKEKKIAGKYYDIVCKPDMEIFESEYIPSYTYTTQSFKSIMNQLLSGTGWTCVSSGTAGKTLTGKTKTKWEILQHALELFKYEVRYDIKNKIIYADTLLGSDRGAYFHHEINLRELTVSSDTYDFCTRLVPIGKNDLSIEAVNGGLNYVTPTIPVPGKTIVKVWTDQRYAVKENLLAAAQEKVDTFSKPYRSYEADVIDLARLKPTTYNYLSYLVGDVITLVDKENKTAEKQRIVGKKEYLRDRLKDSVTIANRPKTIQETSIKQVTEGLTVVKQYIDVLEGEIKLKVSKEELLSDPEIKNSITQAVTPAVVTSVRQSQDYQNDLAEAAKSRDLRLVRNLIESLKVPYEQLTSKAEGVSQTELITTMVNSFVSAFTDLNTLYTTIQADGTITEGEWTQLETAITVYKVALASLEFEITKALYEDFGSLTARMESAETKMTNESIIDTVMKSETFTTALGDVKETTKTEVGTILDGWGVNYTNQLEAFGEVLDPFKSWMRFNASQTTLTIGNSISPFSTEISNSMLAFLESGSIVAYIKSNQMRIQNAVIENSLTVGNHEIFKYDDELTIVSWVGGV